jgi:arylsulfatase A
MLHLRAKTRLGLFALIVLSGVAVAPAAEQVARPNIVMILIDDMGYADLSCYGSKAHRTPHIDRLAAEGMRFTDFHSNGAVCSPTRAAFLTGR